MLQTLINDNIIEPNDYYNKYLTLIYSNNIHESSIINKHHIIPRCYYKHYNLAVDNSSNNVVKLSIPDHILAHYYLYKCSKATWFKNANLCSLMFFLGQKEITEEKLSEFLPEAEEIFKKARQLNIESHTGKNNACYGKHLSEATKQKISKAKKGKYNSNGHLGLKLSEETKQKLSEAHKGENCYMFGKHHSEQTKEKMKQAHLGKIPNWTTEGREKTLSKMRKKVKCVETNISYISINEAIRQTGIKGIGHCVSGKHKTAGNYHWVYVEEDN